MGWPSSIRTWVVGETVTAAKLNETRDALKTIGDPWTPYQPTWTATTTNPTLNNGSLSGAYVQTGKTIDFRVFLAIGSSTNVGAGAWYFSLPFSPNLTPLVGVGSGGLLFDASVGTRHGAQVVTHTIPGQVFLLDVTIGDAVRATTPWTWATSDTLSFAGRYEAL